MDDFASDCDLLMACIILQKQINAINGKKENIIVPSQKMRQLRETLQAGIVNQTFIHDKVYNMILI